MAASASPLMLDCSSPMAHLSGTFSTFMNFTPVRNLFHPQAPEFLICCQIWIKHFHCFNIVWIFTTYSVDPLPLKPQVSSVSWVENLSWFNFSSRLSSNLMVNRSGSPCPPQYFWSSTLWADCSGPAIGKQIVVLPSAFKIKEAPHILEVLLRGPNVHHVLLQQPSSSLVTPHFKGESRVTSSLCSPTSEMLQLWNLLAYMTPLAL